MEFSALNASASHYATAKRAQLIKHHEYWEYSHCAQAQWPWPDNRLTCPESSPGRKNLHPPGRPSWPGLKGSGWPRCWVCPPPNHRQSRQSAVGHPGPRKEWAGEIGRAHV